jgi:hypothetical protein
MLTIRQKNDDGTEQVFAVKAVRYMDRRLPPVDSPYSGRQASVDGESDSGVPYYLETGRIYVMNDLGKTVADYDLDRENGRGCVSSVPAG